MYIKNRRNSSKVKSFGSYQTLYLTENLELRNRLLFHSFRRSTFGMSRCIGKALASLIYWKKQNTSLIPHSNYFWKLELLPIHRDIAQQELRNEIKD